MISPEQRAGVLGAWREGLGSDRLVICGAGPKVRVPKDAGPGTFEAICAEAEAMASQANEGGADALLCFPPFGIQESPDRHKMILDYHERIGRAGLPLILFYFHEGPEGFGYSLDELRDLFALPGVTGIKMATLQGVVVYQAVARMMREEFPDQLLITGEDRFLGYSIILGAQAALIGMGCAFTNFQDQLLQSMRKGEVETFLDLCRRVDALGEAAFCYPIEGYIQRMLWILADAGIVEADATHDLWGPTLDKDAELAFIRKVIEENDIPF
jgi:4-hydroxy-tetrahydrodipicolinate synthase